MKNTTLKKSLIASFLALAISSQISANSETIPNQRTNDLSEKEELFLEELRTLSDIEIRSAIVYASSVGATHLVELSILEGLVSPDAKFKYTLLSAAAS